MMRVTNNSGICLPLAVWLLHDDYDYVDKVNYFSVTTLMRPLKQILLSGRIPVEDREADVADFVARKLGSAIHDSIEGAWLKGHKRALRQLGYPEGVIARIVVNPVTEQLRNVKNIIPVYLEQRAYRVVEVNGGRYTIGGKFDMVADGILADNKSTSAYSWVHGTRDEDHRLQMSLYRWIDQQMEDGLAPRITDDVCNVNYVFTDWQKAQAKSNPAYPQSRVEQKSLVMTPADEIDAWVREKITLIQKYEHFPEHKMPDCTDEQLWRSDPKFKFFADPAKAHTPGSRSTKNFDTLAEANAHKAQAGKGVVVTQPGEVKACGYCPAFDACKQKDQYFL